MDTATATQETTMDAQQNADIYARATGANSVTYRVEQRNADGTLTVLEEAHSGAPQQLPCYHPRSCRACDRTGEPCRTHVVGQRGHEGCTGRDYQAPANAWAELPGTPAAPIHLSLEEAQAWTMGYEAAKGA